MNRYFLTSIFLFCLTTIWAQNESVTKIVTVTEDGMRTEVVVPGIKVEVDEFNDTITKITMGRKRFEVIDDHNRARLRMVRLPIEKFKGHWAGIDIGFNGYVTSDFSTGLPASANFMDLNQGKAVTFSINFLQYNIALQRNKNNLGLVMGSGISWYNYRTDSPYYFQKNPVTNDTEGIPVPDGISVSKNKIESTFINFPLLLEWQLPSSNDANRFFISAGPYAGFRLWGRTKMVYHEGGSRQKEKSKQDINVNPFQYGVMVRLGYRFIKLYGSYNFSTFYSTNKGPELYPYTVGITLLSF
ncbi:outer membrane beta-barrel protein [Carboxylicivirga caseinilyticus]|uniref:outer membrane beta-barrel protein n=1 Tax=Carboxylicivirga caseinilyticus TaxID=3417572 RepID=UPI003D32A075|nr:PorT family protein [Marinilabiliaceae bacterium A049]